MDGLKTGTTQTDTLWSKQRYDEITKEIIGIVDSWIYSVREIGKEEDAEIMADLRSAILERSSKVLKG